ncbi:hypothetical protein N7447_010880 [Penicillium robsamsonii]|uniref:uncharacterized protein n=1 Tax=Penicillium robsamsonii TaxID=1792511 RepID=UPI002546BDAA|nr:uncharacterized protein N7447_010880 [Penicillium robsamsonii]KAJ5807424.1 hypothetical protein N7447_010880 [Penicillium robsamsonii]
MPSLIFSSVLDPKLIARPLLLRYQGETHRRLRALRMSHYECNLEGWVKRSMVEVNPSAQELREVTNYYLSLRLLRKFPEVTDAITLGRLHIHGLVYGSETEKACRVLEEQQNH